jgi:hypothetical protein
MTTPPIGMPVQYNLPEGEGPDANTVYAAIVTAVNADATVNLTVFVDGGQNFSASSVPAQSAGVTTFYSTF